ncbi:hypothetical protein [Streptomyces misionensis]|uniref:hypothetical protein n=1 Tax=Streptomyces misionensis TaxID=67331 RepID=UPI0021BD83CC|nr:hypothetical protein [Streptomyces misionensis]
MLVLRWFRERGCVHCLARDAGVSQATGYRYLHEGIDVLAARAPDLNEVLKSCQTQGMAHVILDRTLIECDRAAGDGENGNDLWFIQKHKAFGGNVQFLSAPDGTPLWVAEVEPGSAPDITPPASTRCPPCTRPPPRACRRWRTRVTSAPASASASRPAARKASPSRPCTPTPAPRTC